MEQSSGILDSRVEQGLRETYDALTRGGKLLSPKRLAESYSTFRAHFGPDTLRSLDGPTLLNTMHAHGSKESLVYWLEFKNDDEFPGPTFGSIAGGAAFKFGLFRRKDTGQWVTGGSTSEKNISEADAVVLARKHREQLLLGMELLEALPDGADDPEYLNLQKRLELQAPDICRLVWAHKYWALLFPEKLDDFHSERWQRHNLLRVLDTPPEQAGLYVCAGRFVRLAAKFGWPINHLDSALVERNGPPAQYWRLETRRGDGSFIWPALRAGAFAAVGWGALGDLSGVAGLAKTRTAILRLLQQHYPSDPKGYAHDASQIRDFIKRVQPGDVVLAADGGRILGTGRVTGPYQYDLSGLADAPHRRAVDWRSTDEWKLSTPEGVHSTFVPIRDYSDIIQSERRLLEGQSGNGPPPPAPPRLDGIPGRIQRVLDRKGQAIVYGPPGTGKTHWARKAALDIAAIAAFGSPLAKLSDNDRNVVQGTGQADGLVRWCTFHPAYGYEDFIEGFRPHQNAAGQLIFERRDGIFKTLCTDAGRAPHRKFLLLVDEINRGDIPRIFGELLTLLENDKRGLPVSLPLSGERFVVPPNVHLLGTMNTADRSIALLDTALRRRFGFVELMPDISVLGTASAGGDIPLGPWLAALNERLRAHLGRDARNLQIGHAYLMENGEPLSDFTRFVRVLAEDLVPLLEEYCYDNYGALAQILGVGLVDEAGQRIREELFAPDRKKDLIPALLSPAPEIVTTAVAAEAAGESEEETDEIPESDAPRDVTTISLREWEIARTDAGSPLSPTDHRLAERLTHTGRMEVLELASCLELRTTSFVGRVAFSELTVTISPKISGAPLLSLFRYAYGLRQLDLYGAADFASSSWSFQDLIIRQLAAEASELLQRGIHREYERVRADLASPRGRIDFACYIHVTRGTETTLPCVYHPRSENTLLNRVLLAGLNLAADLAIDTELKGHVRRLSREFGAMVAAQLLDTQAMSDAWHAMDRRTSVYQPAFRLIDLLLGAQGLALDEQGSSVRLEGFLFDMNRFFQALLSRFLREHLNSVDVHDEFRLRDIFSYEQRRNPLGRRNPSLRPDFVLLRNATIVAVLDAKYRDLWAQPLPREMLYQLALYALGRSGAIREAVILYPTLDGGAREQAIIVQEPLRGRPQARIALRPVNLLELETQLREWRSARLRREALAQRLAFG